MRRESHRRRRGIRRARARAWGHRGVYVGALVATTAIVAGFGSAVLVYGPLGSAAYRQLSASTSTPPPVGVSFGSGQEWQASRLTLTNATLDSPRWNWTNSTGAFSGPCNASGILNASAGGVYDYFDNASSSVNVTAGNVTLVCLNSVGSTFYSPYGGGLDATWYFDALGNPLTHNDYNQTNFMGNGSSFNDTQGNISSCNSWILGPGGQSPWNLTHINDANFTPCNTYYEMNNNTTYVDSFHGQFVGIFSGGIYDGLPEYENSTLWAPDEMGYGPSDVVYAIPVNFSSNSTNGLYAITVSVGGITPVAQTFFFNNTVHGTTRGPGSVLFVFDMTAAWLYDPTYNMTGQVAPSYAPEIYGAIGTASAIVTECSSDRVCPVPSSAEVDQP